MASAYVLYKRFTLLILCLKRFDLSITDRKSNASTVAGSRSLTQVLDMTKKIERNDSCPCGSGKKYKHCCMRIEQSKDNTAAQNRAPLQYSELYAPKILAYLESHNVAPILDYLIALQLNPANNGKNLRFEHIGQLAVSSIGKGNASPDVLVFKHLIDEEYPYDMMEDIPINMFCETVVFHGGNYLFFPGLSTHCSELFRAMTESIYRVDGVFPEAYKAEIYQGVTLILELGNAIATRAGIENTTRGNNNPREKIMEALSNQSYAIPKAMMTYIIKYNQLDECVLDNFLLDKDNPEILTTNPERNPILYKPLVKHNGNFYFIGISNQGCAINNFILKTAIKYNCINELVQLTQDTIWNRVGISCTNLMHWAPMEFQSFQPRDAHYNECLFQIDVNWMAYLCYVKDTPKDVSVDGTETYIHWDIDNRLKKTLATIRNSEQTKGFHIFTLVVYSSMGEPFALMMNEQPKTDYLIHFSAFDFLQLVQTETWDNMSLVRYARTKEHAAALKYGLNQPLDCYSMYKKHGESFYLSDENKYDFIQIEPNEGCELIHESKEKLNFHGTPMHIEGKRIGYIPVQRDIDYASIYKPLNESINAKCCESYSIPIWIKCLQTEKEGDNPSSITETIITAIAFWIDRLKPAIEGYIIKRYTNSVEIELSFNERTLSDKYVHYEIMPPVKNGLMTISKTETGIKVYFDHDYILGFLGANNTQERLMMKNIITSLLGIIEDEWVQAVLDELMPLGQAKMILMMEPSNSPISFPLWLNPPIFIHAASRQLILDHFPQWMKDKGVDITGKLITIAQKNEFLHNGVDVLLEKLNSQVKRFEPHSLLRKLISNHETLLYQREHNKILHPAQILCFGDNDDKRKEFFETELQLTEADIATRALIEYVSATQGSTGQEQAGSNDIESILVIMSEIIHIGGICDAVHLGISDHTIEKLTSGRYGIYDDDFSDCVGGFASARLIETVNNQVEDFGSKMGYLANLQPKTRDESNSNLDEIDAAFLADWGVSYSAILQLLYSCYLLAMTQKRSVIELPEKEFVKAIIEICPELSEEVIEKSLEHLSLAKRTDYLTPPEGMNGKEIFPWIYNRELSYLRRPIVRWQMYDEVNLIYGFRSCLTAGMQLTNLLYSGRLRNVGKKLEKLLGKFESAKGAAFNKEVRKWLQEHTALRIWDYDVPIKPKGTFAASEDLGDIDVFAYDVTKNVVYSIECKNTNTAKNVREMKKEMDDYLGRDGTKKTALVMKHLRRHKWMMDNIEIIRDFVDAKTNPTVKSIMLTSQVIPTSYLRKEDTPLSILNFQELRRKGVEYLEESKISK